MPSNVEVVGLPWVPVNRALRVFYQQTVLAATLARRGLDVFFAAATIAPILAPVRLVLAVQFIQFYEVPEAYGLLRRVYLRCMVPLSVKKAKRVIIFTEHAKRDLVRWTGVSAEKIHVVPHGLSLDVWRLAEVAASAPERRVGANLTGGRPYLLYVSSTYGYKNHARLIRGFGLLKKRTNLPHVLLLVGSEISVSFRELQAIAHRAGVESDVIFAGRLDHHVAAATYLGADLAVIPSLYETFGLPVLEAMACGCPVVSSNMGSMAELSGDAAVLVNPVDENSIADGMECVLRDPSLRQELVARGRQRARGYTWEQSAGRILEICQDAAQA